MLWNGGGKGLGSCVFDGVRRRVPGDLVGVEGTGKLPVWNVEDDSRVCGIVFVEYGRKGCTVPDAGHGIGACGAGLGEVSVVEEVLEGGNPAKGRVLGQSRGLL